MTYEEAKKYINSLGFDLNIDYYPDLKDYIISLAEKDDLESMKHYMCQLQNCGGYALQIPACIFSEKTLDFEEKVIRITELYPFVRLLPDISDKLDEEDIVIFRASKEGGHHFIRLNQDREMIEKESAEMPQKFGSWSENLANCPEVVLAVKRQEYRTPEELELPQCIRSMFLFEDAHYEEDKYGKFVKKTDAPKPITLDDKIRETINNRKNSFTYLGKQIVFKKSKEDKDIILVFCDGQKLGEMLYMDDELEMDISEDKKNELLFKSKGKNPYKEVKSQDDLTL